MRDDWFDDPLEYGELFSNPQDLYRVISEILEQHNGQYLSGGRQIYDIPKASFGLRYALETDFYDRFIYQAIASYLMPFYDPILSNRVLGHRLNKERKSDKYLFKHRIELWNTFEGLTKLPIQEGGSLLVTDLINYYENIRSSSIVEALECQLTGVAASGLEKNRIRNAIHTLENLLNKWSYQGEKGLPQNRDASSFFANVLLNTVDQKMVSKGYDYFRYVDDIRISCKTPQVAQTALHELIKELRQLGLNINSAKTCILHKSSPRSEFDAVFPSHDDRSLAIDNMWRSKSKRIILRSLPLIHEFIVDIVADGKSQSRQFRFCINRLTTIVDAKIVDCEQIITPQLQKILLDLLKEQPASTDYFCKIILTLGPTHPILEETESFLIENSEFITSWQSYKLWLLFARVGYTSEKLTGFAMQKISSDFDCAATPAILIYIGKCEDATNTEQLLAYFTTGISYQHKRCLLIATQDLSRELLKPYIPLLGPRLTNTVSRIASSRALTGKFTHRTKPGKLDNIFEQLNPYD